MTVINYDSLLSTLLADGQSAKQNNQPLMIGITGAPASGKSTLARLIKENLSQRDESLIVNILGLDNFIYPNQLLEENALMDKKGFPESFDTQTLVAFFEELRSETKSIYCTPLYCQTIKDIHPKNKFELSKSDIYLIEGVGLFYNFSTAEKSIQLDHHLNASIYLDTPNDVIKTRAVGRFLSMFAVAKKAIKPTEYFKPLLNYTTEEIEQYALNLWNAVDRPLIDSLLTPERHRATYNLVDVPYQTELPS